MLRYAEQEQLTFTRSRPGRKNDGAHVEQKNWSVVRRYVGDLRYDTPKQVALLNQLYEVLHLYTNFFMPVVKLKEKVRHGSQVTKKYDAPQTPYQRVWASPDVSASGRNMPDSMWSPSTSKSSAWSNNSGRVGDDWPDRRTGRRERLGTSLSRRRLNHVTWLCLSGAQ